MIKSPIPFLPLESIDDNAAKIRDMYGLAFLLFFYANLQKTQGPHKRPPHCVQPEASIFEGISEIKLLIQNVTKLSPMLSPKYLFSVAVGFGP